MADNDLIERLRMEAQIHAQEARTANATIAEIYQLCSGGKGEPGNWHGAEPVRALIAERDAFAATLRQQAGRVDRITKAPFYWEVGGGVKLDAATGYCNGWNDCLAALAQNTQGDGEPVATVYRADRYVLVDGKHRPADLVVVEKNLPPGTKLYIHAERARVPEGWALVPIKPTQQMLDAMGACEYPLNAWDEAIAAAPSQRAEVKP